MSVRISVRHRKAFTCAILGVIFLGVCAPFTAFGQATLPLQGASGVQSGVSFLWEDSQSSPSDPATLQSITIDGKAFDRFAVPSGYELSQPGLNPGDNDIWRDGSIIYNLDVDGPAGWAAAALTAYQSTNLNHYFGSSTNGEDICGDYSAVAATQAVQHTLLYDPPLPVNASGFAAVSERNANNCLHLAVFGYPPDAGPGSPEVLLGETFVRPGLSQSDPKTPPIPPDIGQDYWLTDRVNENNGTIGIAVFKLDELAPAGSLISRVRLTASSADPGDGKFMVVQSYAVSESETMFIEDPPLVGDAGKSDAAPSGSTYTLISGPQHGELTLDPSGNYVYTPETNFVGVDSFRFQVCLPAPNQSVCDEAEVVITVRPRAGDDAAEGVAGQATIIDVLANDPPFMGLADVKLLNASDAEVPSVSVLTQGTWAVSGGGTQVTFTPFLGFTGTPAPVRYVATHMASGLRTNAANVTVSYPSAASIGNRVWLDVNSNGVQDTGETGRNGVTVQLRNSLGTVIANTTTADNPQTGEPGHYRFTGLATGTYSVRFILPDGYVFSPRSGSISVTSNSDADPVTGLTASVSVILGNSITYVDAGLMRVVKNGALTLLKSAEWFQPAQNIARISLEIDARMPLITRDVVLVLDVSSSMSSQVSSVGKSRLELMKEAASDFATQFLATQFQGRHRLSVVSFSATAAVNLGLTSDLQSVLTTLTGLSTASATNTQEGIKLGTSVLDSAPDFPGGLGQADEKMLLVLADGQGNRADNILTTASVTQEDRNAFYFPATYPDGASISLKATSFGTTVQNASTQECSWRAVSQALLSKRKGYKLYGVAFGKESELGALATWTMRHVASQASNYFNTVDSPGNIFNEILQNILSVGNNAVVADVMGFGDGYQWQLITGQPTYPIQTTPSSGFTLGSQTHSGRTVSVINWTPGEMRAGQNELTYFVRLEANKLLANIAGNSPPLPTNYQAQLSYDRLDGQQENVLFPSPALTVPIRSVALSKTDHLSQPVAGAGFTLFADPAGNVLIAAEQMLSGSGPSTLFNGLVRGHTYYMRETTVPVDYIDESSLYRLVVSDSLTPVVTLYNQTSQAFDPVPNSGTGNPIVINRTRARAVADSSFDNPPGLPVTLNVVNNDVAGGYPLNPQSVVFVNPAPGSTLSGDRRTLTVPNQGTWTVNSSNGIVTFTPATGFWGFADLVNYTVSDTRGYPSNSASISVSIQPYLGIGNLVFFDANDSGHFDAGEGIANVPVHLYRAYQTPGIDSPSATTVSAANGTYLFSRLEAGLYFVHIPASAFQVGSPLQGLSTISEGLSGDDDVGQNGRRGGAPEVNGISSGIVSLFHGTTPTLESGETGFLANSDDNLDSAIDLTIDFGFQLPLTLGNRVFLDTNLNGRFDPGEGLGGVTIELFLASQDPQLELPILSQSSTADGSYLFTQLIPGSYRLHVPADQFENGALLWQLESIQGTTPIGDDNIGEDGLDDPLPQRNGISTAPILLQRGTQPTNTSFETGSDQQLDDRNDANGNLTIDLGFRPLDPVLVGIGNLVFVDLNANGHADSSEGVPGVTVQLFADGNDPQSTPPTATTITNANGSYIFRNLPQGVYFIHIPASQFQSTAPLSGMRSLPGAGGDFGIDDDFDENGIDSPEPWFTGISSTSFYLEPDTEPINDWGEWGSDFDLDDADDNNTDLTIDLGFTTPVAVGNLVFLDTNGNHRADPDEGVQGVTLQLFHALAQPQFDTPLAETTTDAQGRYLFTDLAPGQYFIHIPAWMFDPSAPLQTLISLPGSRSSDDDTGEDGLDNSQATSFGISSPVFSLAPGSLPTATTEAGFDSTSDDSADANTDLTRDFGFSLPATLGATLFHDLNANGTHQPLGPDNLPGTPDDEPLLSAVPVEVWFTGDDQILGNTDDTLIDVLETTLDGTCQISSLSTGTYYLRIADGVFTPGGALASLPVATPLRVALDNQTPGDSNGSQPAGRSTATLSPIITLAPGEIDTSIGFGFIATLHPATWPAWQARNAALSDTSPSGNPDGDAFANLLEFAFGLSSQSGLASRPPFRIEVDPASQRIDLCFDRVSSLSGLSLSLELLPSLTNSPNGWIDAASLSPIVTPRPDDTEELRFQDIASHPAFASNPSLGFARIRLALDADLNGQPESVLRSHTLGWSRLSLGTHLQTLGHSFAPLSRFSASVESLSGTSLNLPSALNGASPASLLSPGAQHYLEVLSGTLAGHRLELDETASTTASASLVLDPASPRHTLPGDPPPALIGSQVTLRQHLTLGDLANPSRFTATNNPATADRLLIYNTAASTFQTYWLFTYGGNPRWVRQGDPTFVNQAALIIEPGRGLFIQSRSQSVTLVLSGQVRDHPFANPLLQGVNLVASGWPLPLSPASLQMTAANGFTAASSASSADQLQRWQADTQPSAQGYQGLFYLGFGTFRQWTTIGDNTFTNQSNTPFLNSNRALFIRSRNPIPNWIIPSPWAP